MIAAALFALAAASTDVRAFTLVNSSNQQGWPDSKVVFEVDYSGCSISADDLNAAIDGAIDLWNSVPSSSLHLSRITTPNPQSVTDEQNRTSGNPLITCDPNFSSDSGVDGNLVVGLTRLISNGDGVPQFAILVLNSEAGKKGDISQKSASKRSVIVAHEMGHALGLGHSADSSALMYFSATEKTQIGLAPDDVEGITFLYPRHELVSGQMFGCGTTEFVGPGAPPREPGFGPRARAGAAELALWLAVCALGLWVARARTRTALAAAVTLLLLGAFSQRASADTPESKGEAGHFEFGTTIGTPAVFNLSGGYWSDGDSFPFVARLSGMYYGFALGLQADVGLQFYHQDSLRQFVSITAGTAATASSDGCGYLFRGAGLQYGVQYGNFHFEAGPMFAGVSDDCGDEWRYYVVPSFQIGYTTLF